MTKLCPRGKAAAKRKFRVYPSAYANAYASKICAGKIKDPSGVKRKDFRGPKPSGAKVGMAVTAGAQSGMGRLEKSGLKLSKGGGSDFETSGTRIKPYGKTAAVKIEKLQPRKKVKSYPIGPPLSGDKGMQQPFSKYADKMYVKPKKKMMSGGFGIFGKKKKGEEKKSVQEENASKKKKRLEELKKEIGAKKGKMMIMIAVGKPKKAKEGKFLSVPRGKEKISPGTPGPYKFRRELPNLTRKRKGRTEKEKIIYGPKPNPGPKDNKKKRNILEIMDDVAETINAPFLRQYKNYSKGSPPKGVVKPGMKSPKKKAIPGDPRERHEYIRKIQNPISEYDKKGKLKYTAANKGGSMKLKKVIKGLKKASKLHAGQAKSLSTIKLSKGGGAAIRGTNFKGIF